ncbi:MAG: YgiT-type zinc finger protein [Bacteroidetes bacterium]|nr:YgiT-type zinc finger protein [Bacteroidota bacterium]MBU2584605.1 YgiT-type zinc finger protein [Bacteroidota bacterium]
MKREYSDCYFCGGSVEEKLLPREIRWQNQLFVFENVPMGVCNQCGEKVLKPEIAKHIDSILQKKKKPTRTIQVPVYSLEYGTI